MSLESVNGTLPIHTIPNFQDAEQVAASLPESIADAFDNLAAAKEDAPAALNVDASEINVDVPPSADEVPSTSYFSDACDAIQSRLPSLEQASNFGVTYGLPALAVSGAVSTAYFATRAIQNAKLLNSTDVEKQKIAADKKLSNDVLNIQRALAVASGVVTLASSYAAYEYA